MTPPPEQRFHALDGLRGLAAVAVVFNHLGPTTGNWWLSPVVWFGSVGWLGVDLFFVLSGFLITGILIENREARNYFRVFYAHRSLRILPVYFLLLLIWTIIVPKVAPDYFKSVSAPGTLWPHWLFLTSFWIINTTPVIGPGMAWVTPLGPSWSLSIEEQFYLLWAPVVRWLNSRQLAWLAGGVLLFGIGLRFILLAGGHTPNTIFFFTLTHLDGLCVGILARLAYNAPSARPALLRFARLWWIAALAGAAILILDATFATPALSNSYRPIMIRIGFTVLSVLSAAIVMHGILIDGWVRAVFDLSALRRLGAYSYFIYLFHWTVAFAVVHFTGPLDKSILFPLQLVAIVAAAELSQRLIERPAMRLRRTIAFDGPTNRPVPESATPAQLT